METALLIYFLTAVTIHTAWLFSWFLKADWIENPVVYLSKGAAVALLWPIALPLLGIAYLFR